VGSESWDMEAYGGAFQEVHREDRVEIPSGQVSTVGIHGNERGRRGIWSRAALSWE